MRLVTIRRPEGGFAVGRIDGDGAVDDAVVEIRLADAPQVTDVGALLRVPGWRDLAASATGPRHRLGDLDLAPLVPTPDKIICVGLNYRAHILEMGRDLPEYPTLFAKFPATLTGPYDDIPAPPEDDALDWEAELTVVVGATCRRISESEAADAIAGYTVANDVSMRTWQFRTKEWLQGKMWEASTPVGPALPASALRPSPGRPGSPHPPYPQPARVFFEAGRGLPFRRFSPREDSRSSLRQAYCLWRIACRLRAPLFKKVLPPC